MTKVVYYSIQCSNCKRWFSQGTSKKLFADVKATCKYCNKSYSIRDARKGGTRLKYMGPFDCNGSTRLVQSLNGSDKEVGFGTFSK